MKAVIMSQARRRLIAPRYITLGAEVVGIVAIYLFLFQPFWPATRAAALLLLAVTVFVMAATMRNKALIGRALWIGIPIAIILLGWLIWLSSLPANREAPFDDVESLYDNPQTRSEVQAAFRKNGVLKISVEQSESIRAAQKYP